MAAKLPRWQHFPDPTAARLRSRTRRKFVAYQAEYIWLDGTEPTPLLRSKTKILADGKEPPIWGFDGSSTNQATGEHSDCVLRPVFTCPIRCAAATTSSSWPTSSMPAT
jgi:hypothetical protein